MQDAKQDKLIRVQFYIYRDKNTTLKKTLYFTKLKLKIEKKR